MGFLFNFIGLVIDKVIVGIVRIRVVVKLVDEILFFEEMIILSRFKLEGFFEVMVDWFFCFFFGGIFFDREL